MPKLKLTKRILEASEPKATEYELRDTEIVGFLCKVSPSGRKTFMLQYRNADGKKRKPAIGLFGELTVEQARNIAQRWLSEVREGKDPSQQKKDRRLSATVRDFAQLYLEKQLSVRVKPKTLKMYKYYMNKYIIPRMGKLRIDIVTKRDLKIFIEYYSSTPGVAHICRNFLRGMFTWAENCGVREEDSHPCKGVLVPLKSKKPRLITQPEMVRLMNYLKLSEVEGGTIEAYSLAIRLQFAFAARASEILELQWDWVDFKTRKILWPDSKTGPMWKPISDEAETLLKLAAQRSTGSIFVVPRPDRSGRPILFSTYHRAWRRALEAVDIDRMGTHAIRHRAVTDIANSGVPIKAGMALTAHKRLEIFMGYVHLEDGQVHDAAERVAASRAAKMAALEAKLLE